MADVPVERPQDDSIGERRPGSGGARGTDGVIKRQLIKRGKPRRPAAITCLLFSFFGSVVSRVELFIIALACEVLLFIQGSPQRLPFFQLTDPFSSRDVSLTDLTLDQRSGQWIERKRPMKMRWAIEIGSPPRSGGVHPSFIRAMRNIAMGTSCLL